MTTLGILTAARELLSDEARWTKGAFARDDTGRAYPGPKWERCWCLAGAIYKIDPDGIDAEHALMDALQIPNIRKFNDDATTTHAMILDAFDRAIEKARADG